MYVVKYYYALRVQGEICSRHYFVREGWALNISLFKVTLKVNEYLNKCDCLPRAQNNTVDDKDTLKVEIIDGQVRRWNKAFLLKKKGFISNVFLPKSTWITFVSNFVSWEVIMTNTSFFTLPLKGGQHLYFKLSRFKTRNFLNSKFPPL